MSGNLVTHYIDGLRVEGGLPRQSLISPVDGEAWGELQLADTALLERAVVSSAKAFATWSTLTHKDRAQCFYKYRALLEANLAGLSQGIRRESGKTLGEAEAGLRKGIEVLDFALSIQNLPLDTVSEVSRGIDCSVRRTPLGVCSGITPFNFPAMVPMWMFPLALAVGNTFILKPSEQVPSTSLRLAELFSEAGLPKGVLNVLQGSRDTAEGMARHTGIAAMAFVGSSTAAKNIHALGTAAGKRVLALGGAKNHVVVVPDADIESSAANIVASSTGCAGQRCMAASVLILVGDCGGILEKIRQKAAAIKTGDDMGAIISAKAKERIVVSIDEAEAGGAKILLDGRKVSVAGKEKGNYVGPTIIYEVSPQGLSLKSEIFGPVLSVVQVKTLDEALAIENASPYGNAASIYTTQGEAARYFAQHASAGMIGVNVGVPVPREPFSFGGWNQSRFGIGDITGMEGVHFWTQAKKITVKWVKSSGNNWMS